VEILDEILSLQQTLLTEVIKQKERRDVCPLPSHFTLTYQEEIEEEKTSTPTSVEPVAEPQQKLIVVKKDVTRTCTLRMETVCNHIYM
jgi:hypothetical protein